MTWAQRLKRVFKIDIETCRRCGGTIANLEERAVIERILEHLDRAADPLIRAHAPRAPPPHELPI